MEVRITHLHSHPAFLPLFRDFIITNSTYEKTITNNTMFDRTKYVQQFVHFPSYDLWSGTKSTDNALGYPERKQKFYLRKR